MVAHIDAQIMQKLSKMTPDQILTMQPDISPVTASAVSASVASLMSLSHGAMPDAARTMGQKDSRRLQARNSFNGLTYDSEKNIQSSYLILADDSTDLSSSTLFTRSLPQSPVLTKRDAVSESFLRSLLADNETCILTGGCSPILEKRDFHILSSPTAQDSLVLLGKRDSNELMLFSRADKQHPWKQQLINKLEHAWASVVAMFKGIGISIKVSYYDAIWLPERHLTNVRVIETLQEPRRILCMGKDLEHCCFPFSLLSETGPTLHQRSGYHS
jgi:hypothetical protein